MAACGSTQLRALPRLLLLLAAAAVLLLLVVVPSAPPAVRGRMPRCRRWQQQPCPHAMLVVVRVRASRQGFRGNGRAWAPTGASVEPRACFVVAANCISTFVVLRSVGWSGTWWRWQHVATVGVVPAVCCRFGWWWCVCVCAGGLAHTLGCPRCCIALVAGSLSCLFAGCILSCIRCLGHDTAIAGAP